MNCRQAISVAIFVGSLLVSSTSAQAIVASGSPPSDFTGDWSGTDWSMSTVAVYPWTRASNGVHGSSVAIGANYLLTARHIGADVGQSFSPDGGVTTYTVTGVSYPPNGQNGPIDLCLIKLDKPLTRWEKLYTGTLTPGQATIMVGDGIGGIPHKRNYEFDYGTPQVKRWGTNTIDFVQEVSDGVYFSLGLIQWYNVTDYTSQYEAGLADFDSGGGTFVKLGDSWRLAGLNNGVGESILGGEGYFDRSYAVSVPAYANWLISSMTVPGDANIDGKVSFSDYITLANNFGRTGMTWYEGDFNGDGRVSFSDYILLANNFSQAAPAPEPAALGLLLLGGIAVLLRRRRA